jgi:hypothetical protein
MYRDRGITEMTQRAVVPWKELELDIFLLVLPFVPVVVSLLYDLSVKKHDYFQRSGAVMALLAGILAYRGLSKYWIKAENSFARGSWLRTSRNQTIIDFCTLVISILGTLIWGYGDIVFKKLFL